MSSIKGSIRKVIQILKNNPRGMTKKEIVDKILEDNKNFYDGVKDKTQNLSRNLQYYTIGYKNLKYNPIFRKETKDKDVYFFLINQNQSSKNFSIPLIGKDRDIFENIDITKSIVNKKEFENINSKKAKSSKETEDIRMKAKETGEMAETYVFELLKNKTKQFLKEIIKEEIDVKNYIFETSKDNDYMGCDIKITNKISNKKYYLEIKAVKTLKKISFRLSANEFNKSLELKNYYFVFVDQNWKIAVEEPKKLFDACEFKVDSLQAIVRKKEFRNFEDIKNIMFKN